MIKKETECSSRRANCGRTDTDVAIAVENELCSSGNSGGSSQETMTTYKRRKYINNTSTLTKKIENGNVSVDTFRQHIHKKMNDSRKTVLDHVSNGLYSGSDDSHLNDARNMVLNQLYESIPGSDGGLLRCAKDKVSVQRCVGVDKCPSIPGGMIDRTHISDRGSISVACNSSSSNSSLSNSDLCRQVFLDVVKSEKFTRLSGLLVKNFEGAKFHSILDIRTINLKMKEGAYEKSPMLFQSDMEKVLEHLQKVGAEIVSLSKCLMDNSKASFTQKFPNSDLCVKLELIEACDIPNVCTCRRCGEKAEGKDCLVCDSCEEMFHISCIEPLIEEIPTNNWYCINCVANGSASPHDDCIVCEKLSATLPPNNGFPNQEIELPEGDSTCNICKTDVRNGKRIKVCGHSMCLHRYYHMNCLTFKQLCTYGHCWYCPSCLCRACLIDRDDKAIVLCDGCDSAYHIYCMDPPLPEIPDGKWFCVKCDMDIQKIAKAKRAFEKNNPTNLQKKVEDEKGVEDDMAVDMLLSVARTQIVRRKD